MTAQKMKRIGGIVVLALGLFTGIFVAWALDASPPEPVAYATAISDPRVVIGSRDGFITIRPSAHEPAVGLLFYPGLRVTPSSYVAKLSTLAVSANVQVAIGRPPLNVAVFSIGQADAMRRYDLSVFGQPAIVMVGLDGAASLVRRRETVADIAAGECMPDALARR